MSYQARQTRGVTFREFMIFLIVIGFLLFVGTYFFENGVARFMNSVESRRQMERR